ncbi:hypothetical protein FJY71_00850, partial [candidate division WOR-3 bacterium]|nr:hypothetical protein [candidate division WOR-3 bacterium]
MRRLILTVALLAVLAVLAGPALAVDPQSISLHPGQSWVYVEAAETLYFPPGGTIATGQVVVGKPYAGFWLFGMGDSWGATPTIIATVDYRARVRYPGTNSYYWTPWVNVIPLTWLNTPDTLLFGPCWADDSLGWF